MTEFRGVFPHLWPPTLRNANCHAAIPPRGADPLPRAAPWSPGIHDGQRGPGGQRVGTLSPSGLHKVCPTDSPNCSVTMTSGGTREPDYYRILGVLRTAKRADITAAFHVLARRYHPDVGGTDAESLANFKRINEAYEVLSDEQLRRAYDRRQRDAPVTVPVATGPDSAAVRRPPAELRRPRAASQDIEVELPIAPEEAFHGGPCDFTLQIPTVCRACGGGESVTAGRCATCGGAGMTVDRVPVQFTIPRGIANGAVLRLRGYGRRTPESAGDLLIRIRIQPWW
jgi:DnaJ-class molecular chaperone